jgi:hypothetical protein
VARLINRFRFCASVPEIRPLHPLHEAACIGFALVQGYDPIEAVCALLLGGQAACGT